MITTHIQTITERGAHLALVALLTRAADARKHARVKTPLTRHTASVRHTICGLDPNRKDYQAECLPRNQSNKSVEWMKGFFLSRSISLPLQLLLTIAHQLLPSGSLCNLSLQPRFFRELCFSVRPPSRSLPPRQSRCCWRVPSRVANLCRWSLRCSLAFHSALCNLLIPLKLPLIRIPRITVVAAVSWYYSITLFLIGSLVNIPLGNHSAR